MGAEIFEGSDISDVQDKKERELAAINKSYLKLKEEPVITMTGFADYDDTVRGHRTSLFSTMLDSQGSGDGVPCS